MLNGWILCEKIQEEEVVQQTTSGLFVMADKKPKDLLWINEK